MKPWEHKSLADRQELLTGLANETAWIVLLEKVLPGRAYAAETRSLLAKWAAMGIDPVETRGLPEMAELVEAVAEYRDLYKRLYGTRRSSEGKSKIGRPSIWRGPKGWYFFCCVHNARKEKRRSIAGAIQWVIKNNPHLKDLSRFSAAALQVRYQEAAKEWSWHLKPDEHSAMGVALEDAYDRVRAAHKAWVSFHGREYGLSVRQSDFP
jgi:hypothetical protein